MQQPQTAQSLDIPATYDALRRENLALRDALARLSSDDGTPSPCDHSAGASTDSAGASHSTDYVRECLRESPFAYEVVCAAATLVAVVVVAISWRHLRSLRRAPISPRQQLYISIGWMPIVFALSALLTILTPRAFLLWQLLQKQYEAFALSCFGSLLFLLLAITALAEERTSVADSRLQAAVEPTFLGNGVLALLNQDGPGKHFATPPLLCLCRPCWPRFRLGPLHLVLISYLLFQFVLGTPVLAIVGMWGYISLDAASAHALRAACLALKQLSTLLALWGLFALYQASHDPLRHWNTTKKFVSLKAVLVLELVQEHLIAFLLDAGSYGPGDGLDGATLDACRHGQLVEHFWSQVVLLLECLLMACLIRSAFPPHELARKFAAEQRGMMIGLELMHHFSRSVDLRFSFSGRRFSDASGRPDEDSKQGEPPGAAFCRAHGEEAGGSARWMTWSRATTPLASPAHLAHGGSAEPPRLVLSATEPPAAPDALELRISRAASAAAARAASGDWDAALFGGRPRPWRAGEREGGNDTNTRTSASELV